ncbi:MAG TPA: alpha/beta fold hydrolase [Acidobacteriota bacterium]|nr:alpha/beta fold hydrolase [Acidobacteriota bacterium]
MARKIHVVLSLMLGLAVACGTQLEEADDRLPIGVFQEAPCPVAIPEGWTEGKEITCGYVIVPERHSEPDGPTLKLAIAKISSINESPDPDPIVPLPTGPGSSAFDSFLDFMASPVGAEFLKTREAVIFEQRGLLYSEPNLVCAESHAYFMDRQSQNWSGQKSVEKTVEAFEACKQSLQDRGVNLDAFKYVESAADLIMVMDTLGYDKFNALGISAGTMLSQRLLRDHADRLRSVTINSVAPLDQPLHADFPAFSARSLQHLFEACSADPSCNQAYPDLGVKLERTVKRLNENPVTVEIDDPRSGGKSQVIINGDRFAEVVFVSGYSNYSVPRVPELITLVDSGDEQKLSELAQRMAGPGDQFAWGLGYSVFCSDSLEVTEERITFDGLFPAYEEAVANLVWGPRTLIGICDMWGVERLSPTISTLPVSDVPTLVMSGEFDSITPPEAAARVAAKLTHAYEYTIPGAAHSAIESGPCPFSIALQFLEDPSKEPDASCISDLAIQFHVPGN